MSESVMARQPENPFHPGEILLEEFLKPSDMTQAALAGKLGWTVATLKEFIEGKRGITAASAPDLADVPATSPKLWMNTARIMCARMFFTQTTI